MVSLYNSKEKSEEFDDQGDTPSSSAMYVKKETERLKKLKKQKTRKRKAIYSDTDDEKSQSSDKENKKKRTRKLRKTKYEVTEEISLPEKKPFDIGNRIRDNFGKFRSKKIEETKQNIIGTELNIPMMRYSVEDMWRTFNQLTATSTPIVKYDFEQLIRATTLHFINDSLYSREASRDEWARRMRPSEGTAHMDVTPTAMKAQRASDIARQQSQHGSQLVGPLSQVEKDDTRKQPAKDGDKSIQP